MLMVPRIYVNQELEICEINSKLLKKKIGHLYSQCSYQLIIQLGSLFQYSTVMIQVKLGTNLNP